jgi:hypothetical protein
LPQEKLTFHFLMKIDQKNLLWFSLINKLWLSSNLCLNKSLPIKYLINFQFFLKFFQLILEYSNPSKARSNRFER